MEKMSLTSGLYVTKKCKCHCTKQIIRASVIYCKERCTNPMYK